MKIERLFNVLVLGGALQLGVVACGSGSDDEPVDSTADDVRSEGGGSALDCSDTATSTGPTDALGKACGCECCWATGIPNTDAQACAGFCGECCDAAG
jgi:hypothetical protein